MGCNVFMAAVSVVPKGPVPPCYTIHGKGHQVRRGILRVLSARYHLSTMATLLPRHLRARVAEERSLTSPENLQSMKRHSPSPSGIAIGASSVNILA